MTTIGAYEAKTRFSELLKRIQRGENIRITLHGKVVAVLSPPSPAKETVDLQEVIRQMKVMRKGRTLGGRSIKSMIEEGRRF
jgi:prevent-host-death family protein